VSCNVLKLYVVHTCIYLRTGLIVKVIGFIRFVCWLVIYTESNSNREIEHNKQYSRNLYNKCNLKFNEINMKITLSKGMKQFLFSFFLRLVQLCYIDGCVCGKVPKYRVSLFT
jgi:hypothetical protein